MPVIDTESGKFEYKGRKLSREDISDMEYDKFLKTNRQVGQFTDNIRRGISNYEVGYTGRMKDYKESDHPDLLFNDEENQAIIYNSKKIEVEPGFFKKHAEDGKMFIILINFNPDTMTGDDKSEMRFWIEDSRKVLADNTITEDLKLKTLPPRHFWVWDEDKCVLLMGCKIVQIYSNKKNPFYIGIIVQKAEYDNGK